MVSKMKKYTERLKETLLNDKYKLNADGKEMKKLYEKSYLIIDNKRCELINATNIFEAQKITDTIYEMEEELYRTLNDYILTCASSYNKCDGSYRTSVPNCLMSVTIYSMFKECHRTIGITLDELNLRDFKSIDDVKECKLVPSLFTDEIVAITFKVIYDNGDRYEYRKDNILLLYNIRTSKKYILNMGYDIYDHEVYKMGKGKTKKFYYLLSKSHTSKYILDDNFSVVKTVGNVCKMGNNEHFVIVENNEAKGYFDLRENKLSIPMMFSKATLFDKNNTATVIINNYDSEMVIDRYGNLIK